MSFLQVTLSRTRRSHIIVGLTRLHASQLSSYSQIHTIICFISICPSCKHTVAIRVSSCLKTLGTSDFCRMVCRSAASSSLHHSIFPSTWNSRSSSSCALLHPVESGYRPRRSRLRRNSRRPAILCQLPASFSANSLPCPCLCACFCLSESAV